MKKLKCMVALLLGGLSVLVIPTFAWELNSGTIVSMGFCDTTDTSCTMWGIGITSIATGTFINHTGLIYLDIEGNSITTIEDGTFEGLNNLEELYLNSNQITRIGANTFQGLSSSLWRLNLGNNKINSIETGAFNNFSGLTDLYLDNNNLETVNHGAFDVFSSPLLHFNMEYNYIDITQGSITGYLASLGASYDPQILTGTVTYSPETSTNGSVVATVKFNELGNITSAGGFTHTFTGNGSFTFMFEDFHGNTSSAIATVSWIQTSSSNSNGGGVILQKDDCPNGDNSKSYYDRICDSEVTTVTGDELKNAYDRAYSKGITTLPTFAEARIQETITRKELAKMIGNYAIKVRGMHPSTGAVCDFVDIAQENTELQSYIKLSCQLGLMGIGMEQNRFLPNDIVTRAQFGTLLSRILRGNTYTMDGNLYYINHFKALKDNNIITNTNPDIQELRGYILLMLMRTL